MHGPDDAPTQRFPPVPPATGPGAGAGGAEGAGDETVVLPVVPAGGAYESGSGPVPGLEPADGPPPGLHRQDGPSRPWAWLVAVLAAALLAVGGLVWMIGAAIGNDRPSPAAAPPPTRSATPSPTASPTPSPSPEDTTTASTPPPTSSMPTVTVPVPTVTRVVPTPRPTTPRPTADPGLVMVPDVVGLRVNAARKVLEQAGLDSRIVSFGGNGADRRVVIGQQPRGVQVPRGTTVVLFAGRPRDG